jgi:hypothetical protein
MKHILVIVDGIVGNKLIHRMVDANTGDNSYDIVYTNDYIVPKEIPSNFTFYKFDPTSASKLEIVLNKDIHTDALIALTTKDETLNTLKNIREKKKNLNVTIYDNWNIQLNDNYLSRYNGVNVLANGLLEKLPNIPVVAQNIGLRLGEIMEIKIPFGSTYVYRYVGSIEQKDWKIFGLYRNNQLITVKPTIILKPNDIILIIGKPNILMQVYTAMTKTHGQFPMPFGKNTYLYIDLFVQDESEALNSLKEAIYLHSKIKDKNLYVTITRPTNIPIMTKLKELAHSNENIILNIDYYNLGFSNIVKRDLKRYNVGLIMLTHNLLQYKEAIVDLIDMQIPIYKIGRAKLSRTKDTLIVVNDTKSYEQIAPIIFDVSDQLNTNIKLYNVAPIKIDKVDELIEHVENLAKIFNQNIEIVNKMKNPIRELKKEREILQILPFKKAMFDKRLVNFFSTNSDLLSFDMPDFNQLLIPIIEE